MFRSCVGPLCTTAGSRRLDSRAAAHCHARGSRALAVVPRATPRRRSSCCEELESSAEPRPSASPSSPLGCGGFFIDAGYEELIVPALWESQTFVDKAGPDIVEKLYAFSDKKGRDTCCSGGLPAFPGSVARGLVPREPRPSACSKCALIPTSARRTAATGVTQVGVEMPAERRPATGARSRTCWYRSSNGSYDYQLDRQVRAAWPTTSRPASRGCPGGRAEQVEAAALDGASGGPRSRSLLFAMDDPR